MAFCALPLHNPIFSAGTSRILRDGIPKSCFDLWIYNELVGCCCICFERFAESFFIFAGVKTMTMFCYNVPSKILQNSFWRHWGLLGLLGGALLVASYGYTNHSITKVLWWTLHSGTHESQFHGGYIMNSAFWHSKIMFSLGIYNGVLRSATPQSRFHCGYVKNSAWWHSKIVFWLAEL